MNIKLTVRQKQIINSMESKGSDDLRNILNDLQNEFLDISNIEKICALINEEFMMKGVLPSFEPNSYGYELEALLDVVNSARLRT